MAVLLTAGAWSPSVKTEHSNTFYFSPCMRSPCLAVMALLCKVFLFVPLVHCNCSGSASNRRENVKRNPEKESSKVLSTLPTWWSHGSNDLRGVFGLVQIHRTVSCQRCLKWAKNICKHTHPKTHAAYSCKHTSCVSHKLTYAPHRRYGVCSHSQPLIAILSYRSPNTQLRWEESDPRSWQRVEGKEWKSSGFYDYCAPHSPDYLMVVAQKCSQEWLQGKHRLIPQGALSPAHSWCSTHAISHFHRLLWILQHTQDAPTSSFPKVKSCTQDQGWKLARTALSAWAECYHGKSSYSQKHIFSHKWPVTKNQSPWTDTGTGRSSVH